MFSKEVKDEEGKEERKKKGGERLYLCRLKDQFLTIFALRMDRWMEIDMVLVFGLCVLCVRPS